MSELAELRQDSESPKRQLVLDAATALFMAQGYGAVSMDAIARAAGVSKATLYAYFSSKDQLFATIIGEACRQNIVVSNFLPGDETDVRASLTALAGQTLRFLLEERPLAIQRVVISESVRFPELGRAFHDNGPGVFRRVFGEWLTAETMAGRLAVPDPAIAADQFIGLLRSGLYLRATLGLTPPPTEAEIDATVAATVDIFLKAYGPSGSHATA
ncbi:MAG TPA: TetR/AcrR family transcriptional regulator [Acetobacteraceae bacterium]|jgi:TetR/AcrR family transcriptional regulator, mexJK operon transcriptional repressor|nr:TetR/AcrR family transcriptional regulator [Acetobacteraceae bacterium]